ncbi:hypothetical protein EQV97_06920 [Pseudomonas sp. TMW22090]|nr:hypothetical protein [Pseudomonas sp. TMW22090]
MNRQWMKRARCAAPESLKSKPAQWAKQSDNRLSVRLSNRLLFGYRLRDPRKIAACCSSCRTSRTRRSCRRRRSLAGRNPVQVASA